MAGIGREDYPELLPSEAFEIVEKVGRENVKTATGLASVMGLGSADSGYFYHKVSALTKYYGLLDRAKGNIALTPTGERIAHPLSELDKAQARAEAVQRVSLLTSLFAKLGTGFHEADFKTALRDVTQAPLAEIEKNAPYIEKLYRDAQHYFTQQPVAPSEPQELVETGPRAGGYHAAETVTGPRHEPGYRTFESDGVFMKIKKDRESLEEALTTIQGWLKRHESPKSSTEKQN